MPLHSDFLDTFYSILFGSQLWLSIKGGGNCWALSRNITRYGNGWYGNKVGLERDLALLGILLLLQVGRICRRRPRYEGKRIT